MVGKPVQDWVIRRFALATNRGGASMDAWSPLQGCRREMVRPETQVWRECGGLERFSRENP